MGLSFHDPKSMEEVSRVEALKFKPGIPSLTSGNGTVEERQHEDFENQLLSDELDIQAVDS